MMIDRRTAVAALGSSVAAAFAQDAAAPAAAKGIHADLLTLAEAIPAGKYSWRPAEGVPPISEVSMHIAGANYRIPAGLAVAPPAGITRDMENIVEHLNKSFEHQSKAIAYARMNKVTPPWSAGRE